MAVIFSFATKSDLDVKVTLARQAEVLLLDDENFERRLQGGEYKAHGGLYSVSPAILPLPHPGSWHLVIEEHDQGEATATLLTPAA